MSLKIVNHHYEKNALYREMEFLHQAIRFLPSYTPNVKITRTFLSIYSHACIQIANLYISYGDVKAIRYYGRNQSVRATLHQFSLIRLIYRLLNCRPFNWCKLNYLAGIIMCARYRGYRKEKNRISVSPYFA